MVDTASHGVPDVDPYVDAVDFTTADQPPTLEWTRHDRTHLEISVDYRLTNPDDPSLEWDAYYFIPDSFHLNAETYRKRDVFADLRSHVRLAVPPLNFGDISDEARRVADEVPRLGPDRAIDELKLFGSRLQRSIIDAASVVVADLDNSDADRVAPAIDAFTTSATEIGDETRAALAPLIASDTLNADVVRAAEWIDEYFSRSLERAFIRMARREPDDPPNSTLGAATAAAIGEARYRRHVESGPVSSADGSTTDLERVERRQHSLKRFASSVLWLDTDIRVANQWAEHVLHAIAAGIAMSFAVLAAVLYGNPNDTSRLWVWGLLVVVAYMGKDRIKVLLQGIFDAVLEDRFADRRWTVRYPDQPAALAEVTEKARFVDRDELPTAVSQIRTDAYRDTLQEIAAPDRILHHRKQIRLHPKAIAGVDSRFDALIEVVRMDISRWLVHTDDAKRTVTLADPDLNELFTSKLPRAYDVIAVYRLCGHPSVSDPWQSARFVVSRNGIRRVGVLDDGSQASR